MPVDIRITESGDTRITTSGDTRITDESDNIILAASASTLLRITEAGDQRITEDGLDNRVISEGQIGIGGATATVTNIPFTTQVYAKHSGTWQQVTPCVKYNGSWVQPDNMWVYYNNRWNRLF